MATLAVMNLKQAQAAINEFAYKDIVKMSRSAVARGSNRFKTRVKQSVPKQTGELKKSIVTGRRKGKSQFDPLRIVYSNIGYYNTLLFNYREDYTYRRKNSYIDINVNGHKVANPSGNWWDIAVKRYGKEYEKNIAEFLDDGMRKAAAKSYAKTFVKAPVTI